MKAGKGSMACPHRGTNRPFTVIVCTACATGHARSVVDELRTGIQPCPHAMLVCAGCMRGPLCCAFCSTGRGVMAVLQPCTKDRVACGMAHWIGPITQRSDAAVLADWIELGQREIMPLPPELTGVISGRVELGKAIER
jgi:hypothetical protein